MRKNKILDMVFNTLYNIMCDRKGEENRMTRNKNPCTK